MPRRYTLDGNKRQLNLRIDTTVYDALCAEEERRRREDFVTSKAEIVESALRWYLQIPFPAHVYRMLDEMVARAREYDTTATRATMIAAAVEQMYTAFIHGGLAG